MNEMMEAELTEHIGAEPGVQSAHQEDVGNVDRGKRWSIITSNIKFYVKN